MASNAMRLYSGEGTRLLASVTKSSLTLDSLNTITWTPTEDGALSVLVEPFGRDGGVYGLWTVPTTLAAQADYQVRINHRTASGASGTSGTFSLAP